MVYFLFGAEGGIIKMIFYIVFEGTKFPNFN